ncbi:MAG TPA: hypothetical protein GX706_00975 [Candidatus Moranbacteria bacterium]|nr:hypothetical protein [Candidatus Moranbacteria bacterium]
MKRVLKRVLILVTYLVIALSLGLVFYFFLKPASSCEDGIRNQGEAQVDCGGPCRPCSSVVSLQELEMGEIEWINQAENNYDVTIQVRNPNEFYGVAKFKFKIYDRIKGETEASWQEGFILPGETKRLIAYGVTAVNDQAPDFVIKLDKDSFIWEKFSDYAMPNLEIYNPAYQELEQGSPFFSRVNGVVVNNSNVDLETIKVKVFLKDDQNKLLATGEQAMNTVQAGNRREFIINFPHRINGVISSVEREVETNIFDSENYIRVHGQPERWDYKQ